MYFSELFSIRDPERYDWFDPILERDSELFVDPFLVFADDNPDWQAAHSEIVKYFHDAYEYLANADMRPNHQFFKLVLRLMEFPEPREMRLGYAAKNPDDGLGSGKGFARQIVDAMCEAINRGLQDMRHFEELGILVEGIGRDRISDITCNLVRPRLIEYTQRECAKVRVLLTPIQIERATFDSTRRRWVPKEMALPLDDQGRPILLVPKRFLGKLPTLNAEDWYDQLGDSELRDDLNLEISTKVRKADIIRLARQHTQNVRDWVLAREHQGAMPYDVDTDPEAYVKWQRVGHAAADDLPLGQTDIKIGTVAQLVEFIRMIVDRFRDLVEKRGLWKVMWSDSACTKSIPEANMQLIFMAAVDRYCEEAGVTMDREVETGRGPVDFVFTTGQRVRVLLEVKKLSHGEFWNGLRVQTPIYMDGLGVGRAVFLSIRDSSTNLMTKRWLQLSGMGAKASGKGRHIDIERIDALRKVSASKAKDV